MKLKDIVSVNGKVTYVLRKDGCEDISTRVPMTIDIENIEMTPFDHDYYSYISNWMESHKPDYYFQVRV